MMTQRGYNYIPGRELRKCSALRSTRGSSFIEVAFAAMLMSLMMLFVLDIGILMIAYSVNDRACRDACRAAAQASGTNEAAQRANAKARVDSVLAQYNTGGAGVILTSPERDTDVDDEGVFWSNPPSGQNAFVRVTTRSTIRVPAPALFGGVKLSPNGVIVKKQYTFPITGMVNF